MKYYYSRNFSFIAAIFIAFLLSLFCYMLVDSIVKSMYKWALIISPFVLVVIWGSYYFMRNFILRAFRNEIILEFDETKLTYYITNEFVYWDDIIDINTSSSSKNDFLILLKLSDESELGISTKWISGDHNKIYDQIVNYWENS
ncbi:hypothetical protein EOD41_07665 [Mucilaginibacter limnophilus]|uniref:Uncharacterized protein n=1 Tax=Mucilaginibacter limnophilus TaxID=1932778 RepID=A0A437MVZ5_9SPHI|nr:hypothetical protein [Mucilaginibacter limnophilus]RVU01825.1 hypothetical protein EOD41_07665 [Mucilaginibacter limnophilus]